jgi:hypothetical protein
MLAVPRVTATAISRRNSITARISAALEQLAPARLRGAKPDELELAEAAIGSTNRPPGDTLILESVAAELDSAALAHLPFDQGDGLHFRLAAGRARARRRPRDEVVDRRLPRGSRRGRSWSVVHRPALDAPGDR